MSEFMPCEVIKDLYVSGMMAVVEKNLRERNIKFVLNITFENPVKEIKNIRTDKIEIDDLPTAKIIDFFDPYSDLIDQYLVSFDLIFILISLHFLPNF